MKCPSCDHDNPPKARYCGRCRMSFSAVNLQLVRFHGHLNWILRRASAGFFSGLIAWFFIPFVGRILSQESSEIFTLMVSGLMGGAFLGAVEGMVEDSTPKTFRGAVIGGLGGIIGGLAFLTVKGAVGPENILWSVFLYWGIAGAFVGSVSAALEKKKEKLIAGVVMGFLGGGIGGYLGAWVHANIQNQLSPESWLANRFSESLIGGLIGLSLWFFIGLAERFVIFKRKFDPKADSKECHSCHEQNPLLSWYCVECGAVLQISVPSGKLHLPPFEVLNRIRELCHFLARLSTATGFIAGFVSLFVFLPGNPFLVLMVLILTALISYGLQMVFTAAGESIEIWMGRSSGN